MTVKNLSILGKATFWTAIGSIVAVITLFNSCKNTESEYRVLTVDEAGYPVPVIVVGPENKHRISDSAGYTVIPKSWQYREISVRAASREYREIFHGLFLPNSSGVMRLTVGAE